MRGEFALLYYEDQSCECEGALASIESNVEEDFIGLAKCCLWVNASQTQRSVRGEEMAVAMVRGKCL